MFYCSDVDNTHSHHETLLDLLLLHLVISSMALGGTEAQRLKIQQFNELDKHPRLTIRQEYMKTRSLTPKIMQLM